MRAILPCKIGYSACQNKRAIISMESIVREDTTFTITVHMDGKTEETTNVGEWGRIIVDDEEA